MTPEEGQAAADDHGRVRRSAARQPTRAPTARISLDEQPRRRSRGAAADTVSDAAVTRQLGAQKTDGLVPIQAPDPREVAEVEDISAVEPAAPMTRKLGRRRQEAEVAEREAAEDEAREQEDGPQARRRRPPNRSPRTASSCLP